MSREELAIIVGAVVVLVLLVALTRGGRRRSNPLREADSFANARRLTTQWATEPASAPEPVKQAPRVADTLSAEAEGQATS